MKSKNIFGLRPTSLLLRAQSELSLKVAAIAAVYLFTSTVLVFTSKSVMINYGFPFPVTLTALQQLIFALFTFTIGSFGTVYHVLRIAFRCQLILSSYHFYFFLTLIFSTIHYIFLIYHFILHFF